MPLIKGYGRKSIGKNIAKEMRAGKPAKQAQAIGLSVARRAADKGKRKSARAALAKLKRKPRAGKSNLALLRKMKR